MNENCHLDNFKGFVLFNDSFILLYDSNQIVLY